MAFLLSFVAKYRFYWTWIVFSRGHRSKFIWCCSRKLKRCTKKDHPLKNCKFLIKDDANDFSSLFQKVKKYLWLFLDRENMLSYLFMDNGKEKPYQSKMLWGLLTFHRDAASNIRGKTLIERLGSVRFFYKSCAFLQPVSHGEERGKVLFSKNSCRSESF